MAGPPDLTRMVPGFDFLQGLLKNASAGLPNIGQWVAPTLNPEELEKRIQELKTVHFWLEQNARLLSTTIQALEVQRMTLSTLQSMNMPLADLAASLRIKVPVATAPVAAAPAPLADPSATAPRPSTPRKATAAAAPATASKPGTPAVDPMQWWGALTQQFTELATKAVKDGATDSARALAGSVVRTSLDSAGGALKKAAAVPAKAAARAVRAAAPRKR